MMEITQQGNKMVEITKKAKEMTEIKTSIKNQDNKQHAQCVSGEDAIVSCNNLSFQEQINSGNNALGQD